MNPEYMPDGEEQILGYLVEEAGEVLAAVGKSQRWGLESCNPELSRGEQEENGFWILRELIDLERAIKLTREMLDEKGFTYKEPDAGEEG